MSVFIKTMTNLPEYCYECPCHDGESGYCQADKEHRYSVYRPFWCPLVKTSNECREDTLQIIDNTGKGEPKGYCKDCKYFEYDSVAKVDGIPLIVAHEMCSRWGDGCKSKENGYCFLFEPQEREDKE